MRTKLTFKKCYQHWKTIRSHRKWVRHYCFLAGIPWRGITHDLSKYSPIEFFESAKYWTGVDSPINHAKKHQGVSYGWLHHKGRNSHHYEYWMDNFDDGGIARLMPKKDFTEMVCDYLGAAHAYTQEEFSYAKELEWWRNKHDKCSMNEKNKIMLDIIFSDLANAEMYASDKRFVPPEKLIKSKYIQQVWEANK